MGFLSGIKFGAGVILGLIGAIVLLAVLVALVTPEKPAPHAEPVTQELTSASNESNAPMEHAEEASVTQEPQSENITEPECGAKDGVCPKGCTGLLDEDCVLSADKKWVLENGVGVWIESAKLEECVQTFDNEKKYYIVVKVHAENKGSEYENFVIGLQDTSIILDGKTVEQAPGGPSLQFIGTTCETKYEDAEDHIGDLAPGTSGEAYIVFDVTKFGNVRGKDILFVWDPNMFIKGDEVVWKLRVS